MTRWGDVVFEVLAFLTVPQLVQKYVRTTCVSGWTRRERVDPPAYAGGSDSPPPTP